MDEILPETACPGRAVMVLEVSLETNDKGRGMNSRVSEKPTRARLLDLFCFGLPPGEECADDFGDSFGFSITSIDSACATSGRGGESMAFSPGCPKVVGLVGALLPRLRALSKTGGCRIGSSLVEIAPDMPRR